MNSRRHGRLLPASLHSRRWRDPRAAKPDHSEWQDEKHPGKAVMASCDGGLKNFGGFTYSSQCHDEPRYQIRVATLDTDADAALSHLLLSLA